MTEAAAFLDGNPMVGSWGAGAEAPAYASEDAGAEAPAYAQINREDGQRKRIPRTRRTWRTSRTRRPTRRLVDLVRERSDRDRVRVRAVVGDERVVVLVDEEVAGLAAHE
jgi:hypothetical protein